MLISGFWDTEKPLSYLCGYFPVTSHIIPNFVWAILKPPPKQKKRSSGRRKIKKSISFDFGEPKINSAVRELNISSHGGWVKA